MHKYTLAIARAIGAIVVLSALGVTLSISYKFGSEQYGGGSPVYGILWASFAAVASVCAFSLFGSREARVQIAAGIVVALCVICSGAGSVISLGSRQDQLERAEAARESRQQSIKAARDALAAIPVHRDSVAIESEQRLIAEAHRKAPRAQRDNERDLALINELELGRRAAKLREQILTLEAAAEADTGPRPTAVVSWLAAQTGASRTTVGTILIMVFVLTQEAVSALGLYCIFGGMLHSSPAPRQRESIPAPEPAESELVQALDPVGRLAAPAPETAHSHVDTVLQSDPVAVFLDEMIVPDEAAVTPYGDIDAAWQAWCKERGIDGIAINLGLSLRRAGYEAVKLPGSRKTARKGLRIAVSKAA